MNLVDLIPFGKENTINRHDLIKAYAQATNYSERTAEREFHKFLANCRIDNVIISTGDGYYRPLPNRPDEVEETRRFAKRMHYRATETLKNITYTNKWLADADSGRL